MIIVPIIASIIHNNYFSDAKLSLTPGATRRDFVFDEDYRSLPLSLSLDIKAKYH